jgi:hypothetical protein
VQGTVLCLKNNWNPVFAVNAEEYGQMELFWIMTTLGLVRQQRPLKRFEIRKLKFRLLRHPALPPIPRPIWLPYFEPLGDGLLGRRFANDEERGQGRGAYWPCARPKIFFADDIRKLVHRSNKRVEKEINFPFWNPLVISRLTFPSITVTSCRKRSCRRFEPCTMRGASLCYVKAGGGHTRVYPSFRTKSITK